MLPKGGMGKGGNLNILDFVPVGHENAVDREELERRTGLNDRVNRDLIEKAWTKEGKAIINNGRGQGYYVVDPADPEDVRNLMVYLAKIDATIRSLKDKREVGYDILREVVSSE